jgi:hypothetical protein
MSRPDSTLRKPADVAQALAQGQQQVEHHADAGQRLARKRIALEVRIDDGGGGGEHLAGQVMIRDQHAHAGRVRSVDAADAGDAAIHGQQQVGAEFT